MVYKNNFVVAVKVGGKILREDGENVYLPFSSEYSLLLKNLNSVRALVKISIDSEDVLDDNALIIEPDRELELEGFMKGRVARNKFKFIKKTQEISDFRGDRVDDGIIRIEYWYEKVYEKRHVITEHVYHHWYPANCPYNCNWCNNWNCWKRNICKPQVWYDSVSFGSIGGSCSGMGNLTSNNISSSVGQSDGSVSFSATVGDNNETYTSSQILTEKSSHQVNCFVNQVQDEGITVKGSEVNQQFVSGNIGDLEENSRVIILKLIGTSETGKVIEKPVTVKTKKQCKTCGKKSKSNLKYCSSCGTFLE